MSPAKGELLFVGPVVAIFALALILLLSASSGQASGSGRAMIGTITYKNHVAERKASSQVMWSALAQSSPVYNGDTIYTTAGASAILHLDEEAEISLGEETLVRIEVSPKKAEILLDGGEVSVRKEKTGHELGIATSAAKIDVREGALSVEGAADGMVVSVVEGGASWDAGKGSQEIRAGTSLRLESGRAMQPAAQLLAPAVGSAIYRTSEDAPIQFQWSANQANKDRSRTWRLVVASDSKFKQIEASRDAKGSDASLALGEGTHYWKITASASGDAAPGESAVGWFHLLRQDSPQPIEPAVDRVLASGERPPLVAFAWSGVDNASGYRLSVMNADTGATVVSRLVAGRSIALDSLAGGSYRWHVGALCAPDGQEFPGPVSSFSIAPQALGPPIFRAQAADKGDASPAISVVALSHGRSIASWDEVPGANHYEARISRDREGKVPLATTRTSLNAASSPIPLPVGDYYLQVRSFSGSSASDYSPPIAFAVTAPQAILALSPAEGFVADPETRRQRFDWDDPNDSGRVKLQLSADPSFERPIVELLCSGNATWVDIPSEANGRIYWRVAPLSDDRGKASGPLSLRMPLLLAPPRIAGPGEGKIIDLSSTAKLLLSWESSSSANRYHVGLYQLAGGKRTLIREWDGPELFASLPRLRDLGIGYYSWSVSALQVAGPETTARSPEETAYFSLSHSHPLPPPVVHRPAKGTKP